MPYIDKEKRASVGVEPGPISCGELNYLITSTCHEYIKRMGLSYQSINSVIGALECAKLELYRQIAVPYEEIKKAKNGPVSTLDAKSV